MKKTAEEMREIILTTLLKKLPDKDWFVPNHNIFRGLTAYEHEEIYHEYDQWKNPGRMINRFGISSRDFMEFVIYQQVTAATSALQKEVDELRREREWISVEDRLPELDDMECEFVKMVKGKCLRSNIYEWYVFKHFWAYELKYDYTHWRPFVGPTPSPTEVKKEEQL